MFAWFEFTDDYRSFKKGDRFELREGLNYLVGDQGAGKSTILSQLAHVCGVGRAHEKKIRGGSRPGAGGAKVKFFDFEKDNPRVQSEFGAMDLSAHVQAMFLSHGEFVRAALQGLEHATSTVGSMLFLLDEPDAALSPRTVYALSEIFQQAANKGCQIIAAVHNPILIESVPEVLSIEHKRWMPSAEFMASQREPRPKPPAPAPAPRRSRNPCT